MGELLVESKSCAITDAISYNAAITACEKCDDWKRAFVLLKAMWMERVWPDMASYSAGISSCNKGKR